MYVVNMVFGPIQDVTWTRDISDNIRRMTGDLQARLALYLLPRRDHQSALDHSRAVAFALWLLAGCCHSIMCLLYVFIIIIK